MAAKLDVSRPAEQRLVSLAVFEHLVKHRLDHPPTDCIAPAEAVRDRGSSSRGSSPTR